MTTGEDLDAEWRAGDYADSAIVPDGSASLSGSTGSYGTPLEPVLNRVRAHFEKYVVTMNAGDLDLLAIWTVSTHLCMETYTTPRLILDSPIPGSGKTTVLEHIERLALNPVQMSTISSSALLVRMLENGIRTLEIDEVDRTLRPDKPGVEDLLGILNSGYKRGATRPVLTPAKGGDWKVSEMPTFAPVVMAGNAPHLPDDTRSRCITVLLRPAQGDEIDETDWELLDEDTRKLGDAVSTATEQVRDAVRLHRPDVPKGCIGRMKERWLPLKRVAAAASKEWEKKVDALIDNDLDNERMMREEGLQSRPPHVALLYDVKKIFDTEEESFIKTEDLIGRLMTRNPFLWSQESKRGKDLTAQGLGRMLVSRYGIHSARSLDDGRPRGYRREDFETAFRFMQVA